MPHGRPQLSAERGPPPQQTRQRPPVSETPLSSPLLPAPRAGYVELHCHSAFSLREGASTPLQLVLRARDLGYDTLALTDHDGLYGAMEFAKAADAWGIRPITGAELTLQDGHHLTLLAATRQGYANLCRLISHAHHHSPRGEPRLDPALFARHAEGLIALSGCANGLIPALLDAGERAEAARIAERYARWFGRENFYLELQQNLVHGDSARIEALVELAQRLGLGVVATNNAHYHIRTRHRVHDVLVAIRHRLTLDSSHRERRANSEFFLKPAGEMATLFAQYPEAVTNSRRIAEQCVFNLATDLEYRFPEYGELAARPSERTPPPAPPPAAARRGETQITGVSIPGRPPTGALRADQLCSTPGLGSPLREQSSGGGVGGGVKQVGGSATVGAEAAAPDPALILDIFCRTELTNRYNRHLDPATFNEAEARLQEELRLIRKHGLAGFFLCYRDILQLSKEVAAEVYGRDPRRPAQERPPGRGRGSSVGSIVCYLIGLSHIDPIATKLFLGRFLNEEMASVPDIDIDFPREVRARLIERMYERFGHEHVALVCSFPTYQLRSAIRDVGKVLGLPAADLDTLAKLSEHGGAKAIGEAMARLPQFAGRVNDPVWRDLIDLAKEIDGFPRHISQHVGGMVIASQPIKELVPVEPAAMAGRYLCQWDKDSVDDARFIKIDFLALGMLSLVDECLESLLEEHGQHPDLGRISHTDTRVYDSICAGDTLGVFQIESRAQIQTLPRTKPRTIADLIVEVAIIRPGPISGGALNPYINRRMGREPVSYDHPSLEPVLEETLGVILFQEQVLQTAMAVAGFSAGQAETMRRAMSRKRSREALGQMWAPFRAGAMARDVPAETAQLIFTKLLGFAEFGFPKSHSAAFALLAYESAWLKLYHPAHFYAALFNCQLMGFYSPAVLTGDARRHGIRVLPPAVNQSGPRCTVEDGQLRLGFNYVEGLGGKEKVRPRLTPPPSLPERRGVTCRELGRDEWSDPEADEGIESLAGDDRYDGICARDSRVVDDERRLSNLTEATQGIPLCKRSLGGGTEGGVKQAGDARTVEKPPSPNVRIAAERERNGPYRSLFEFVQRTALRREQVERLIAVGAFDQFGLGRRELIWQLGLFFRPVTAQLALPWPLDGAMVPLPEPNAWERMASEYAILGLSPEGHPLALLRPHLHEGIVASRQLGQLRDGADVTVAGLVVCRQRPGTAKGFLFLSLEDEFGLANVIVKPALYEQARLTLRAEPFVLISGELQSRDNTTNVIARRVLPLSATAAGANLPRQFSAPRSKDWG